MNQRTVDTPLDESIRREQARVRLDLGKEAAKVVEQDPKVYGDYFSFRVRQWKNTQFAGLWELCVIDNKGHVIEQVTDADALSNCLENIGAILENRGF